jgi:hypothetical protein
MVRFSLKQLLLGTVVIALGLTTLIALKRIARPFDNAAFTPAAWAKADPTGRALMSGDLVRNHLRKGLSRSQVEALIGRTDSKMGPNGGDGARGAETHKYYIGSWSMHGMDDAFVYVHYDVSGNLIDAEINGY